MGYKIGMVGMGHFGRRFVELFKAHPLCDEVVLCELRPDVLAETAKEEKIERTMTSYDELLKSDVDGVAIFTQRWTHARLAIDALKAGKHVYSSVPAGVHPDELDELVKTVEETGLTYALGETSFYRPQAMWCRKQFAEGKFGRFVYGEGHYYHDMSHWFYLPFYDANGPDWKKYASVPPMWYISHSASHILSTTFSRFTSVSCLGWSDDHEDGIFNRELSAFDNDFANQSALLRTADGGMARINEFRRSAMGESRQCIVGTEGAYEEQCNPEKIEEQSVEDQMAGKKAARAQSRAVWTEKAWKEDPHDENGNFDFRKAEHAAEKIREDMTWIHPMPGVEITEENIGNLPRSYLGKMHLGVGPLHPIERLPKEFVGLANGHCGSHQFLVHDFFEAMDTGKLPPNHVWIGARYSAPAGIAHESSKRDGERLPVPDFGIPPADKECIDPLVKLRD
ncbi:MAG: Gfo/Idh/MocA family protein [Candidatus Sumerlaeia bacterium]